MIILHNLPAGLLFLAALILTAFGALTKRLWPGYAGGFAWAGATLCALVAGAGLAEPLAMALALLCLARLGKGARP